MMSGICRFIAAGMAEIHHRIVATGCFRGSGPDEFAEGAGPAKGDVNHALPFREGNGRTPLQYPKQLAARARYAIDLTRIDSAAWLEASRLFNTGDHAAITRCIRQALAYRVPKPKEQATLCETGPAPEPVRQRSSAGRKRPFAPGSGTRPRLRRPRPSEPSWPPPIPRRPLHVPPAPGSTTVARNPASARFTRRMSPP